MSKQKIFAAVFLIILLSQSASLFGQNRCLFGKVVIEYSVSGRIIKTPLNGIQVSLFVQGQTNPAYRTVTNENGFFYFFNLPYSSYNVTFSFGNELLHIDKRSIDNVNESINNSAYSFAYSIQEKNIGLFIIAKDTIRSMQL